MKIITDKISENKRIKIIYSVFETIGYISLLIICTSFLISDSFNPFIYFRFWGRGMKNKILVILFIIIIFGLGFFSIILKDREVSSFERRKLTSFPKLDENFTNN